MCAVLGLYLKNPDMNQVERLILESSIRGLHATGLTYLKDGKLHTVKHSVPAKSFLSAFDLGSCVDGDSLKMIVHCRYSTSDLRYNQPIHKGDLSIVHNGVISQELPENWFDLYGYETETHNDTELLFESRRDGHSPFDWTDASISAIELQQDGIMRFYRNGKRPLHFMTTDNGNIISSTKDIFNRSGVKGDRSVCDPGMVYYIGESDEIYSEGEELYDLQELSYV